ncbi:MAG TPA: hypothetical protein VHE13_00360 [Opitutus sp.]|nr:hypothetical protein [Opitutus sp.]
MHTAASSSARRCVVAWPARRRAWLQHLDRIVVPPPPFERAAGPRLRPFPDWARQPAVSAHDPATARAA